MDNQLRIGIVGGGQLGRMLGHSAKKLGFRVCVVDPTPNSPAGQVVDQQIVGGYKDEKAIRELTNLSDIVTFEIELANEEVLLSEMKKGKIVHPSPHTLAIIRDKFKQKEFLRKNKLPVADFLEVKTPEDIEKASEKFGYPLLLKARTDAYDGRGNFVVKKKSDILKGMEKLKGRALYVEKFVPFVKELAIMVARSTTGEIKTYPVVQTKHVDNICDTVLVPALVSKKIANKASTIAKKTMQQLKGAGVFGIEMFLTKDGSVLINEIAPRVHNSGHYTIEACVTSQFEQHIRAVAGLPLGSTEMITKYAVMKNILGEKAGTGVPASLEKALKIPGVSIHVYGKKDSRPQRKMGHITVVGANMKDCLKKANKARKMLVI